MMQTKRSIKKQRRKYILKGVLQFSVKMCRLKATVKVMGFQFVLSFYALDCLETYGNSFAQK
jgi:hypothetical protein